MRQHKLALCKEHYLDWLPDQVEHAIQKYHMFSRDEKILVAVSGGKDSLSLWDILHRLEYKVDGIYINLGIDGGGNYSSISQTLTEQFSNQRSLLLHIVDFQYQYGVTIPELAARTNRGKSKPCSVCGLSKRHIMNRIAKEGNYDVLVTGHNLDDEAAVLFGNTLTWSSSYLLRQAPMLPSDHPGLARKAKPLCRTYEREMAAYALLRGISYIYEECPYAIGSTSIYHKELLNKLEGDRPGAKLSFYLSFLQAKESGLFSQTADLQAEKLHPCTSCAQPTTAPGLCAFCRMFTK